MVIRELSKRSGDQACVPGLTLQTVPETVIFEARDTAKATHLAYGNVNVFGEEVLARMNGAGGQNRTGYARLFRAALYH